MTQADPATEPTGDWAPSSRWPVVFRRLAPSDALGLAAMTRDPSVYASLLELPHPGVEQWHGLLSRLGANDHFLGAVAQDQLVGWASLSVVAEARRRHVGVLGLVVAKPAWGKGVGRALLGEVLGLADRWLNLKRVELSVLTDNTRAIDLYARAGFEIEGTQRCFMFRDGAYADAYLMSRLYDPQAQPR